MPKSSSFNSRRGAILILLTVMLPFLLLPLVGLAIDGTVVHIVQTKLQAAVDGAALGAGRLLGTSADASEIAGEFFKANFSVGKPGFWSATLPNPDSNPSISVTTGVSKSITVSASAQVPTLFMRVLGFNTATVSASAQVTRRDTRMIFVLDRSGSMALSKLPDGNYPIDDVKSYAASLIKGFTPGVDEIGLVVFDGSGVVGYPSSTSYNPTVVATGGPDGSFWDGSANGSSNPPDAVYQIGKVSAGSGTGMADALSLAYIELQKAHKRDLAANGSDNKLNLIVLFTDGVPSGISLYANDPNHGGPWLSSSSGCGNYNNGASNPVYFSIYATSSNNGNPPYSGTDKNYQLASYNVSGSNANSNTQWTPLYWMAHAGAETSPPSLPGNEGASGSTCQNNIDSLSALTQIPATDKWGNATTIGDGNGYKDSYYINSSGVHDTSYYIYNSTKGNLNLSQKTTAYDWGIAMWDAADNAAKNIRTDANHTARGEASPMYIQIFTIGYSGDGGTDAGLLKRLSNDATNTNSPNALPSAWISQPPGKFVLATNASALSEAFSTIGSLVLRLTM